MDTSIWDANVELTTENDDHSHVVRSAREAVAFLMTSWPNNKGPSYAIAKRACLDAVNGTRPNAEARATFEAAAAEAGILRQDPNKNKFAGRGRSPTL
jgi:hypothetical protein